MISRSEMTKGTEVCRDRGAVMVEFALILPLLLMLVIGIIQFGFALNAQVAIQAAAREGARVAAVGGDGMAAAEDSLGEMPQVADFAVDPIDPCSSSVDDDDVVVRVSAQYPFSIPFVPNLGSVTLRATAKMRCEI